MGRLIKSAEEKMKELLEVRMKLGVYAFPEGGYVQLEEPKGDGIFTVKAHMNGKGITNPRIIEPVYVFQQAEYCEQKKCHFTPKHKPDEFGAIVNSKTGQLFEEFTADKWISGDTENFVPIVTKVEVEEVGESVILSEFFNDWK